MCVCSAENKNSVCQKNNNHGNLFPSLNYLTVEYLIFGSHDFLSLSKKNIPFLTNLCIANVYIIMYNIHMYPIRYNPGPVTI